MDPNAAWQTLCDWQANDLDDRADAAAALVDWLDSGGHLPDNMTPAVVRSTAATVLAAAWSTR